MVDFSVPGILGSITNVATGGSAEAWISLAVYLIVSILATGIVLVIFLKILGRVWGEDYDLGRTFILAIVVTFINFFVMGFIAPAFAIIPPIILSILIWIALVKVFFSQISIIKVIIVAVIGLLLTAMVVPIIAGLIMSFIPSFGL